MKRAILVTAAVALALVALDLFGLRYGYTPIEAYPGGYALVAGGAAICIAALAYIARGLRRRPDLYDDERAGERDDERESLRGEAVIAPAEDAT